MTPRSGRSRRSERWSRAETTSGHRATSHNAPGIAAPIIVGGTARRHAGKPVPTRVRSNSTGVSTWSVGCACRRHQAAHGSNGDFGTSPLSLGTSRARHCLPVQTHMGCRTRSAMAGRTSASIRRRRSRRKLAMSTSFDADFCRVTARVARQRELLECAAEQNRRDAGNDHFRFALRAHRRSVLFGWQLLASHMMSYHPTMFGASSTDERNPVR
jgi:hypothetical protein